MPPGPESTANDQGEPLAVEVKSPMESHSGYRGDDWTPERLLFHQNLETFAERVGLIVGLQANGKISQEVAFAQIKKIWKALKESKDLLING